MASKTSRRRRTPRRPNAPRVPGAASAAPSAAARAAGPTPQAARGANSVAAIDENLSTTYGHVARDLRRILVLAIVMFGLIYGSTLVANSLGSNFVIDLFR